MKIPSIAAWAVLLLTSLITVPLARAEIERFEEFAPGLWRGSQPENDADYQRLKDLGIQTIINIRRGELVELERGVAAAKGFGFIAESMHAFQDPGKQRVARLLQALTNPALGRIFLHCAHGADRTGLIVGLYRVKVQGWSRDAAYAEMKQHDFHDELVPLSAFFWSATSSRLMGTWRFLKHLADPFDGYRGDDEGEGEVGEGERSDLPSREGR